MAKLEYYESFDREWEVESLYRELLLVDSDQLLQSIRLCRPFHLAIASVDTMVDKTSSRRIHSILKRLSPIDGKRFYDRLLIGTESPKHPFDQIVQMIASEYVDLLRERRVFLARFPDSPPSFQRTYGALGAAQSFVLLPDGNWDASALLSDEPT